MAERFANVKEVPGAAAKIENAQRRRAIQPKILRALDVDVDPIGKVFEAIDLRRARSIRILLAQLFELRAVERVKDAAFVDGVRRTAEMFERAGE